MKILHIGKYFAPFHGGIENFMAELMNQQVAEGHQVSAVVHHHEKNKAYVQTLENSVVVHKIPTYGQLAYAPISLSFVFYLDKVIKAEKPDVLHIHMPNLSAFWCLFLPSARKIPWVVHWHADVLGSVPDLKIKLLYPFYRVFEKALLNRAEKIIATSPVYFETSLPLSNIADKVAVIPLGLPDMEQSHSLSTSNNNNLKLLIVGRLTYYKGHTLLLAAIAKLKERNIAIELTIIGNGELKLQIQHLIRQLSLSEQVNMLNNLSESDLRNQLANTDLICLPSIERTEAFGVVLLEAMRASKPCLVSDVEGSGMSWVVQDKKTGFVVKHNSVNSLVETLNYICSNRELLTEYGKVGRKRFQQHFSISSISQKISDLYKTL